MKLNRQVAKKTLDAIKKNRDAFDMGTWFADRGYLGDSIVLAPEDENYCGTVMCLAGWAAHVAGWTLHTDEPAEKPGEADESIETVGARELGFPKFVSPEMFFVGEDAALAILERCVTLDEDYETAFETVVGRRDHTVDRAFGRPA